MKLFAVVSILSIGFTASSYAQNRIVESITANTAGIELYKICQTSDLDCDEVIESMAIAVAIYEATNSMRPYCPPAKTDAIQSRLVVMKYMQEHPEQLHKPAFDLVTIAMHRGFPCPKPN